MDFFGSGNRVFLKMGEVYCTREPMLITTVLGSCVSVCLWDPARKIGGLNHFATTLEDAALLSTKSARPAMERLLEDVLSLGTSKGSLIAGIYGGGRVLNIGDSKYHIGRMNIDFAMDFLLRKGIRIADRHFGKDMGRKIEFNTSTGEVKVIPVNSIFKTPLPTGLELAPLTSSGFLI